MRVRYERKTVKVKAFAVSEKEKPNGGFEDGVLYASFSRNCDCASGAIECGIGITPYDFEGRTIRLPEEHESIRFFFLLQNQDENGVLKKYLGFTDRSNALYVYNIGSGWIKHTLFPGEVMGVTAFDEEKNQVLILSNGTEVYTYDGKTVPTKIEGLQYIKSVCCFNGRVFCANNAYELFYSAPFHPNDFSESIDEGGRIILPSNKGTFECMVAMKNKLFLFFERGIFSLDGAGSARDFRLQEIGYGEGRIIGSSVGVCAAEQEQAFFLAENGLYAFDGNCVKPACENLVIQPKSGGQVCVHAEFDGKYYLNYQMTDDVLDTIVVDARSGLGYHTFFANLDGVRTEPFLCEVNGLVCRVGEKGGMYANNLFSFYSPKVDFGIHGRKTVKEIRIYGEGNVWVTVNNGARSQSANKDLKNGPICMRLDMIGESVTVHIILEQNARVTDMEADVVYAKRNGIRSMSV